MRPAARLAAAIEILDAWLQGDGPLDRLVAAWGTTHRFAGAKDRAAIAGRVFAALRRRASAAALMGHESGRGLVLGTLGLEDGLTADAVAELLREGGPHAPPPLSEAEHAALQAGLDPALPPWIWGNYPAWLHAPLAETFGEGLAEEMAALSARAPLDLRVNTLKATFEEVRAALAAEGLDAAPCRFSPTGLRLPPGTPVARSRAYREGLAEIQDEGSQLASLLAGAEPGMTVIDLAAGAGGKALALAAAMANRGRIIACDIDAERLARLPPRADRAGAGIIETRTLRPWESGPDPDFADLPEGADLVLLDAPCSGSGTWRREPEAKWRLTPERLRALTRIQAGLLRRACGLVRPGGRLAYVTCSILGCENSGAVHAVLEQSGNFELIFHDRALNRPGLDAISGRMAGGGVLLSTARAGTDGFFIACLARKASGVDGS